MKTPRVADPASNYAEWRAQRHALMPTTDRSRLADAVRAATGERAVAWERLIGGEVNEVYAAALTTGAEVIVRISRQPVTRFESERWALAAARDAGVPVPEMLHLSQDDGRERRLLGVRREPPGRVRSRGSRRSP